MCSNVFSQWRIEDSTRPKRFYNVHVLVRLDAPSSPTEELHFVQVQALQPITEDCNYIAAFEANILPVYVFVRFCQMYHLRKGLHNCEKSFDMCTCLLQSVIVLEMICENPISNCLRL